MARRTTLTDMLQTLFERRGGRGKLADRSIEDLSLALLDVEGEVSGVALAQAVLDRYAQMSDAEKLAFFQFLNAALEIDPTALSTAVQTFQNSQTVSAF